MKTIHLLCSLVALIILTVVLAGVEPPAPHANAESHVEGVGAAEKVDVVENRPEQEKPAKAPEKKQDGGKKKPPEPVRPVPVIGCGPHSPKVVYDILIDIGVPRLAAIQQLGSWKHESGGGFDQCQKRGDGGIAWGLNSWHPGRRRDMPQDLRAQITWAIHTEMARDCRSCYERFMGAKDIQSVRQAIKESTRWGIIGNRWHYADVFSQQL